MEKLRLSLLAVIFGSVFFVLGRTILLTPSEGNSTVSPLVFPKAVPLPEWQNLPSSPLAAPIAKMPHFLSGRHYRYIQKGLPLDIEMRYLVNTGGDVKGYIHTYSSMPLSSSQLTLAVRQHSGIGFYSLSAYQHRAYLSTCINAHGGTTVTEVQFTLNQYIYDLRWGRLLTWLLGQGTARDWRCLWAHLSIPINNSSQSDAYQTLETAWFDWYKWWRPRLPKS